jgi:hypothetical protein
MSILAPHACCRNKVVPELEGMTRSYKAAISQLNMVFRLSENGHSRDIDVTIRTADDRIYLELK